MHLLGLVIRLAPLGVACLVFTLAWRLGLDLFVRLAAYVAVVLAGPRAAAVRRLRGVGAWLGGMSPLHFFRATRAATVTAFSTASSNATLPTALWVAEHELHLPPHVSRFVLTLGSTANQNGTALFEGVTVLFLAQFYGVELTLGQQATTAFICVLGGIGTAGVPAGSLPVIAMILGMIGVPAEGIGIVLGVDRFLDMCRTAVNVTGDLAAAVVVSRGEPAELGGRGRRQRSDGVVAGRAAGPGRGHHRVPADLVDGPPDPRLVAAGPRSARAEERARGVRGGDPGRRDPRGARPLRAARGADGARPASGAIRPGLRLLAPRGARVRSRGAARPAARRPDRAVPVPARARARGAVRGRALDDLARPRAHARRRAPRSSRSPRAQRSRSGCSSAWRCGRERRAR